MVDTSGTQQYRYDCAGRLAQALDASGNVLATYTYGAGNQRLVSVEGGVTKYYAWDGGQIIAEYEAWGTNGLIWKTSYVYLGGRLLATTSGADGSETRFHYPDRLGTRLVTNASAGAVVSEQWTLPFGMMLPFVSAPGGESPYQNPTLSNPSKKRFTTYDRSDATGLDYAVNRHYSPQQGRFTQVDPIGMGAVSLSDPQTLNLYSYCGNDPINHVDSEGLLFGWLKKLFRVILKIAAVIVTVAAVLATVWSGNPFITIAAWKLWLGAGALWAAAYGAGKLSRVLGRAGFGGGGSDFRTPKTFPSGTGVGAVSAFLPSPQRQRPQKESARFVPWVISDFWQLYDQVRRGEKRAELSDRNRAECALLPQRWTASRGGQSYKMERWKQGAKLTDRPRLAYGTVIATFGPDGRYTGNGESHTAIFAGYQQVNGQDGINVIHQYHGVRDNYGSAFDWLPFGDNSVPYWTLAKIRAFS